MLECENYSNIQMYSNIHTIFHRICIWTFVLVKFLLWIYSDIHSYNSLYTNVFGHLFQCIIGWLQSLARASPRLIWPNRGRIRRVTSLFSTGANCILHILHVVGQFCTPGDTDNTYLPLTSAWPIRRKLVKQSPLDENGIILSLKSFGD